MNRNTASPFGPVEHNRRGQEALREAGGARSDGLYQIGELDREQRDGLVQVLFGDLKSLKPGKITKKIIKLATEDRNVLRYLFGDGAKVAVTETRTSLNVTLVPNPNDDVGIAISC